MNQTAINYQDNVITLPKRNNVIPFPIYPDNIYKQDSEGVIYRQDNATGLLVPRALDLKENEIFMRLTPENKITRHLPTQINLPVGYKDEFFEYETITGKPTVSTGGEDDVNYVDVSATEDGVPIIRIDLGYRYTLEEIDSFKAASRFGLQAYNLDIAERKLTATLETLEEETKLIQCYGKPDRSLWGLFNHPAVPEYIETVFDPYASTDAIAIYNWIILTIRAVMRNASNKRELPNTMLVPEDFYNLITTIRDTNSNGKSVKQMLAEDYPELEIDTMFQLEADELEKFGIRSVGDNQDMIFLGNRAPKKYTSRLGQYRPLQFVPLLKGGYKRVVTRAIRGVQFHYAASGLYVFFPKKV